MVCAVGLVCWTLGFLYEWFRISLWIFDILLIPAMGLLYFGGFVAVAVAAIKRRSGARGVLILVVLALAMLLVNPGHRIAPKTYFALHRPLFEMARQTDPGPDYYGNPLPWPLRFLTADGNVSAVSAGEQEADPGTLFFPQWIGIPDDAGGYLYSAEGAPAGADLYGSLCRNPVDLGGGWWMCNMGDTGW